MIDRQVAAGGGLAPRDSEHSVCDAQVGVCGNYIDVVGLYAHSLPDFGHRHPGGLRKQFGEYAFVLGLQVLYQDKSHPRIQRQSCQEFREGFQSAGRCSDTYDRESPIVLLRGAFCSDGFCGGNFTAGCRRTTPCGPSFGRFWRSSFHRISPVRTPAYRGSLPCRSFHRGYHGLTASSREGVGDLPLPCHPALHLSPTSRALIARPLDRPPDL